MSEGRLSWKSSHENDGLCKYGERDLMGYAAWPPRVRWPKSAKVALNFVLHYEEGGEECVLHGDAWSERRLSDLDGATSYEGRRLSNMESLYEYGARSGFWRLHRLFTSRQVPCTVFAVGMALERNPAVCLALRELSKKESWEIASQGYRWIDYSQADEQTEREHIARSVKIHEKLIGKRPVGYFHSQPSANTRKLVVEEGGFKYDSNSYSDDIPYWTLDYGTIPHLIIPYSMAENDARLVGPSSFKTGTEFGEFLSHTLRYLIDEGENGQQKIMSVGLHCRFASAGRIAGLADFVDFAKRNQSDIWFCTREQIADHWQLNHFPKGAAGLVKPWWKNS